MPWLVHVFITTWKIATFTSRSAFLALRCELYPTHIHRCCSCTLYAKKSPTYSNTTTRVGWSCPRSLRRPVVSPECNLSGCVPGASAVWLYPSQSHFYPGMHARASCRCYRNGVRSSKQYHTGYTCVVPHLGLCLFSIYSTKQSTRRHNLRNSVRVYCVYNSHSI